MTLVEQVVISVVASMLTAFFAYLGFWRKASAELKKEMSYKYNERKWDTYFKCIELINLYQEEPLYKITRNVSKQKNDDFLDIEEKIQRLSYYLDVEILLVGSKSVVEAYVNWRNAILFSPYNKPKTYELMIVLINKMRSDLGLKNSSLNYKIFDTFAYCSEGENDIKKENLL